MTFFTFSKDTQWTGLESLPGRFWPPSHIFDTPDPNLISDKKNIKLIISVNAICTDDGFDRSLLMLGSRPGCPCCGILTDVSERGAVIWD